MLTSLLNRLTSAWQKRESPALRWALSMGGLAVAAVTAHTARQGTGTARTLAEQLGQDDIAELLEETLEEEKETDERLTELAESNINAEAEAAGDDDKE